MSGTKYVLKNNTTLVQFFDYKNLSNAMWNYQVQLNPGQIKTIWAKTETLKIYNNGAITIEEQSVFPPTDHNTGGNNGTNTFIDYTNKSILVFSELPDSGNLGYSILDFDNNVIVGPIDLGYDNNNGNWFVDSIFPFTNSGYAIYLYDDDNNDKATIYLDYRGTIIGQYSASTNNRSYDIFGGKYSYFTDYVNGVMVYSDGKNFNSLEFNTGYTFSVSGNYDGCTKDGFIIDTQLANYRSYSIVTMDNIIPLISWNTDNTEVGLFEYENSNFYTTLNYVTGDNYYLSLNIYSSNGATLHSINLTEDDDYNNFDLTFFGTNKMNIIFYNDGEGGSSIPYLIFTYDGETNTLISTTHDRVNYPDWGQMRDTLYGGNTQFPSQDLHIWFYNETGVNDSFIQNTYFDVLSYFSGDTEYRGVYVVNNDNGVYVSNDYYLGSSHMLFLDDDSGFLKLLTITSEGTSTNTITQLSQLTDYNFNTWWVGDTYIFKVNTGVNAGIIYIYDALGNQLDYKLYFGGYDLFYSYGTVYLILDPNESQESYYFNTKNLQFLPIEYYSSRYTSDYYYDSTFKLSSNILLVRYNGDTPICRLLSENNLTPEVSLPTTYNEPSIGVGKDVILYLYINNNNQAVINLYNTSFGLLQSVTTNYNGWNSWDVAENRVTVTMSNGGIFSYMVSANGIKSVERTFNNDSVRPNDYYWWNY